MFSHSFSSVLWNLSITSPTKKCVFTCAFVFQVWLFMKVVPCTMCSCAGGPLISSGMSITTIKAETWRPHTAFTATCGCLSHTHTQSPTHTHKPPDWSHHLDAPSTSSPCAWMWPLTPPHKSKAQASMSSVSRQFDMILTLSGTNPLSLHHPVVGGANQWEGPQCWEEPYLKSTLEDTQTDSNDILNCYFEPGVLDQPLSIEVRLQSTHRLKIIMHTNYYCC